MPTSTVSKLNTAYPFTKAMTNNQPTSPTSTETKLRLAEAELKALRRQAEADQQQIQLLESRLAKADVDGLTERMGGIKVEAKASDNASPAGRPACYYAVAVGRNPGIYESCNEAAKQVRRSRSAAADTGRVQAFQAACTSGSTPASRQR